MTDLERGRKTILVVDDEPAVRDSTALLLEMLDFSVMEAGDARSALLALEENASVDLLFTDLALPDGVSGADLARQALAMRPGLKILLTTGRPGLVKAESFTMIGKPFRMADLARKIKEAMGAGTPG
jgi:DNA-binding NtrC family response regulator